MIWLITNKEGLSDARGSPSLFIYGQIETAIVADMTGN